MGFFFPFMQILCLFSAMLGMAFLGNAFLSGHDMSLRLMFAAIGCFSLGVSALTARYLR